MAELEGLRVRVLKSLLALATVFENETKPNQAHCFLFPNCLIFLFQQPTF